jgi:antitoxin component YwqK of YwqJK toxin-antitoxin module
LTNDCYFMKYLPLLTFFLSLTVAAPAQLWMNDGVLLANEAIASVELAENLPKSGVVNAYITEGLLHYAATVKNYRFHGRWSSWYPNGTVCDAGALVNGLPDGEWKVWYPNGQLKFIRTYHADKWHRIKDDLQRNHPRFKNYVITSLFNSNIQMGKQYLTASYSFNNNAAAMYTNWLQRVTANTSSNTYLPIFNKCLQHGLFMNFTEQGLVKDSGYYVNGLRHGVWLHRDADNTTKKGFYKHGKKNGEWKQFSKNGQLMHVLFYNKNGVLTGSKQINKVSMQHN